MVDNRRVSKLYRKVITSNELKAFLILENCNEETKELVKQKLEQNNTEHAKLLLSKIQNL